MKYNYKLIMFSWLIWALMISFVITIELGKNSPNKYLILLLLIMLIILNLSLNFLIILFNSLKKFK